MSAIIKRSKLQTICCRAQSQKSDAVVTFAVISSPARREAYSGPRSVSNGEFRRVNGVTHVPDGMNQRRITYFSSQSADEYFHELRVVFVRMFPNLLTQLGPRENATGLPH